jgi:hypothetical protein
MCALDSSPEFAMTFTTNSQEPAAAAFTYQAPENTRASVHVEESPCIVMPAIDLRRALYAPWRPRTMQAWLT